jgi:hypothetical protein
VSPISFRTRACRISRSSSESGGIEENADAVLFPTSTCCDEQDKGDGRVTLDLHQVQHSIRTFGRELELHPLASWRSWERLVDPSEPDEDRLDPERFGQGDSIRALQDHKTIVIWGGSRSGKTAAMMAALIALMLGSDHPDAVAFWHLNRCDPARFPTGPGKVWLTALTNEASLQYHRKPVIALLPRTGPEHPLSEVRGQPWHAWNLDGRGPARVEVMVPGHSNPALLAFKSDTGEDGAKGDDCRAILHDEEPENPEFFDEAEKRLWREDGWQILCNAPTKKAGKRWGYKRFVEQRQPRCWVGWLWVKDNPHVSQNRVKLQAGRADADARTKGKFYDAEGTVFPWSPSRHVVDGLAALIPPRWPRHRAIDWGFRDPFCCLWMTYSRGPIQVPDGRVLADGSILVYRERYVAEVTVPAHADAIHAIEGWVRSDGGVWLRGASTEHVVGGWADTEAPGNIAAFNEAGLVTYETTDKRREAGIALLQQLLEGDSAGPRFFVDASCVHLIEQIPAAVYTDKTRETIQRGADHALDPARYGAMGLMELNTASASTRTINDGLRRLFSRRR